MTVRELSTSESEEMYLIHVAMAQERGVRGPVSVSHLAEMLSVSPVSANQMVRKLAGRGLVEYLPYKGVDLTEAGRRVAMRVLRGRRLWALFLHERLHLPVARADEIACDFEHVTPLDVADGLAALLGDPVAGPQGGKIPGSSSSPSSPPVLPLSELELAADATIVAIEGPAALASFLSGEGIRPGREIELLAIGSRGDCLVRAGAAEVRLGAEVARLISVRSPE